MTTIHDIANAPRETHASAHDASPAVSSVSAAPVGRLAPSPSGRMHLGNVFAALVAWLSARSAGGRLVLRVEDLDERTRSGPWTELMLDDLRWLGLYWDGDVVYQHDRLELYQAAIDTLEARGLIYPCFCTRAQLQRQASAAPNLGDTQRIYGGACAHLTREEATRLSLVRPPALRVRVPDEEIHFVISSIRDFFK